MCGGNPPGASHAEIQRTRTETVFLRQAEQQETRTAQTQAIQQETAQATQTAAPPLTVFARTAQQEAQKSGCARRSAEKQLQKNREESKKRAKKYEKSRNPEQLLETYLREQEESLGTFQIEQEGGEELNELTQAGLSLEYQAMKQVKDPVKARDFFDKIRYFQNCIRLTQKSILQASVRRYVLMPRLQAEGRLNEDECAAICAHHQKSMGSLTTLRGYVEELKTGLKSLLPEGEQLNEASGEELAQYESQILQRAVQRAGRTEREKPDGEIIGEKRARVQIFAERNTALPKTLVNYDRRRRAFEQATPSIKTQGRMARLAPLDGSLGVYSQADYNLFRQADREQALGAYIDKLIASNETRFNSMSPTSAKKELAGDKLNRLKKYRDQMAAMPPAEAEAAIAEYMSYLSSSCAWSRRLPARVVDLILKSDDHRIKTQFETGTSEAALSLGSREDMAREDFGADITSLQDSEHENYGYLSNRDLDLEAANDGMDSYGTVMISFKKSVIANRTTLALGDTLKMQQEGCIPCRAAQPDACVADRYRYPTILAAALAHRDRMKADEQAKVPDINDELFKMGIEGLSYAELQFHGELKIDSEYVDQVLMIRRKFADEPDRQKEEDDRIAAIEKKLKDMGITNVVIREKEAGVGAARTV